MRKVKRVLENYQKKAKEKKVRIKNNKRNIQPINQCELHSQIQRKAYELYETRGYEHGYDLADWREAERLISSGGAQVIEG